MKSKIAIILIVISCNLISVNMIDMKLVLKNEIDYSDISDEFYGTNYNEVRFIDDDTIGFYDGSKYLTYDFKKLNSITVCAKGQGPGECLSPSSLVKFDNKYLMIDKKKRSLLLFDSSFNFIEETKLDYAPYSIFKIEADKFGIFHTVNDSNMLIDIYNERLEKIDSMFNVNSIDLDYSSPLKMFLYEWAFYIIFNNKLYISIRGLPTIQCYDLESNSLSSINYEKKVSFKPTKPILNSKQISLKYSADIIDCNNSDNDFIFLNITNVHDDNTDIFDHYILRYDLSTGLIAMLNIISDIELSSSPILIYGGDLVWFDEENEKVIFFEMSFN